MESMRAITVEPGVARSLQLEELPVPDAARGSVLVKAVALGVCGTDREIVAGKIGSPPPGRSRLVIGHESLGRVVDAPSDSGLSPGDLVMGVVRHPDPVPCRNCAVGEWDMCRNDQYTEHGIKSLDGFGSEYYRLDPRFVVPVTPLGDLGVLTEPASIAAKAWEHVEHIGRRARWEPRRVLVTGAGPIGLLAALFGVQRELDIHVFDHHESGAKPQLVRDLGATFHSGELEAVERDFDLVIEATGSAALVVAVHAHTSPNAIVCLLGVSESGEERSVDVGAANERLVSGNRVTFGSVNANRRHYERAVRALCDADRAWLARLITRRVPIGQWHEAFSKTPGDVKTVIDFSA